MNPVCESRFAGHMSKVMTNASSEVEPLART